MPRPKLAAKSESPTHDHAGFRRRRRGLAFGRRPAAPARWWPPPRPRRPARPGPACRPCRRRAPPGRPPVRPPDPSRPSSAALVSTNGLRGVAVGAFGRSRHRARHREGGHQVEALGDRVAGVVGRHRHRRVAAEHLADARGVDDDVVADLDAPVAGQRQQVGERRRARLVGRVEHHQQLAALGQVGLERVDLRREEVGARAGDDHHRRAVGHGRLLRQHQLLDGVVVAVSACGDRAVAGRARCWSGPSRRGPR